MQILIRTVLQFASHFLNKSPSSSNATELQLMTYCWNWKGIKMSHFWKKKHYKCCFLVTVGAALYKICTRHFPEGLCQSKYLTLNFQLNTTIFSSHILITDRFFKPKGKPNLTDICPLLTIAVMWDKFHIVGIQTA